MNILNDDYGCYYIGFFIARLNMTLHSKQFLPLFKEDTATILHEYVHYLQDISTMTLSKSGSQLLSEGSLLSSSSVHVCLTDRRLVL